MPRPYPDSAKRKNFCGGWDFQKVQPVAGFLVSLGFLIAALLHFVAG
jgi:hypothetical protein